MSLITKKDIALGKRIKKYRKLAELTQEQLADKVRVSTTHIGLVETGKRHVSLKTLQSEIGKISEQKAKPIIDLSLIDNLPKKFLSMLQSLEFEEKQLFLRDV